VFAYKVAVAIKNFGYTNVKIYNGGLKDWTRAGNPVETRRALPDYAGAFITANELMAAVEMSSDKACRDAGNQPLLTILDLRTENFLETGPSFVSIKTVCQTITCLLDDLARDEIRRRIPRQGLVVTVTETGNRDKFVMKYLYRYGYTNIKGLEFGMRGWIKSNYPVERKNEHK
jgi:rhodanese-related sulfurtransferase